MRTPYDRMLADLHSRLDEPATETAALAPGKRTLTSRLAAQRIDRAGADAGVGLPGDLRAQLERALGVDLSSVRMHVGADSARAAKAVDAKAYTTGQDIHFGDGEFDPASGSGQQLIAHEVAHTVQQRGASAAPAGELQVSDPGERSEREAHEFADAFARGDQAAVTPVQTASVARQVIARDLGDKKKGDVEYRPTFTVAPASLRVLVNDTGSVKATVSNAASAEAGTTFEWDASSDQKTHSVTTKPSGASCDVTVAVSASDNGTLGIGVQATGPDEDFEDSWGKASRQQVKIEVPKPKPDWMLIMKGDKADGTKMTVKDTVDFQCEMTNTKTIEKGFLIGLSFDGKGALDGGMKSFAGTKALWSYTAKTPGKVTVTCEATAPGEPKIEEKHTIEIVADLDWLRDTMNAAHTAVDQKYMGAHGKLDSVVKEYAGALSEHQTAVSAANSRFQQRVQLAQSLLTGVFFAALGGGPGGAVAQAMKNKMGAKAASSLGGAAFIDASKDVTKFCVRALQKLGKGGAGEKGGEKGGGGKGGGEMGSDPAVWAASISKRINEEGEALLAQIKAVQLAIRDAKTADDVELDLEGDPVAAIEGDAFLNALGAIKDAKKIDFAKQLWSIWVSNYAYTVVKYDTYHPYGGGKRTAFRIDDNTDDPLIEAIVAQAGTDFGLKARLVAARKAKEEEMKKAHKDHYGW